jgi:hypothetical protein
MGNLFAALGFLFRRDAGYQPNMGTENKAKAVAALRKYHVFED